MTFYVYKAQRGNYPDNWSLVSQWENYEAAREAAKSLCPKGQEIYTEPGRDLPGPAWFGSNATDRWAAMIDTKDIHTERAA